MDTKEFIEKGTAAWNDRDRDGFLALCDENPGESASCLLQLKAPDPRPERCDRQFDRAPDFAVLRDAESIWAHYCARGRRFVVRFTSAESR